MRKKLSKIKHFLITYLVITPLSLLLKLFGPSIYLKVKEKLSSIKLLDYENSNIKLVVDSSIHLQRIQSCKKEPDTVKWIEEYLSSGGVFYDIGANVGAYSLVAAAQLKDSKNSHVYCFEPLATTFHSLVYNVELNDFNELISCFPFAIGDKTEFKKIYLSSLQSGSAMHSVGVAKDAYGNDFKPASIQKILCYNLDEVFSNFKLKEPTIIKIDVDGIELEIIKNCKNILKKPSLKSILVEVRKDSTDYQEIIDFLADYNFNLNTTGSVTSKEFENLIFVKS